MADNVAQVTIQIATLQEPQTVTLRGLLTIHPDWGAIAPSVTMESISTPANGRHFRRHLSTRQLQPVKGRINTWTFSAASVPHGTYEFEIDPPFFLLSDEVDAATTELRLSVPAPAIVAVRTIDEDGVEIADVTSLDWNPQLPRGVLAGALKSVRRDPATGRFEIRAPSGGIFVSVGDTEFLGGMAFDLGPGRHEVDLVVRQCVGFVLILRDKEAVLPWQDSWDVSAQEVGGEGKSYGWSAHEHGRRIAVSKPGLYQFSVPLVDGFLSPPEQQVLVPERGFVEHVVELVRSQ